MSPANATEIEIAGGDKFEVGKIYDVKLTTGFEFKGIVLAYDPDPHFVIFQEGTIPETGDSMNTRMVNDDFISTLTYIGKCEDPLASKERWIDLSGLEEKEAIAIREIESIGVGVTAEAQKVFNDLSKTKIESIGVGVVAEAQKSFDALSKTYPVEQDLVVEMEIEIAGGDKFEVGKIYDVKLTTGFEFKGIVLAYDPDPHFVIFQEGTIPETGDSMNTRMVNDDFISTLTYIGKCEDPLASKERWIDLSGLEEKEAIAIREIESIGVGVTAEAQKVFNDLSKTKIESIGVGVVAEAQKSFDALSKTYPVEQDLVVEILPFPVMRAQIVAVNIALKKNIFAQKSSRATNGVYFFVNDKMKKVAVFKPEEEEDEGDSRWMKGEKANREVAAYLLDLPKEKEGDGFGGVPPTTMVRCMDFKGDREKRWIKGSLQQFIPNQKWYVHGERSDDIFSLRDFQKMTLLDIRYGNTDRNQDNILNQEGKLIPIDHGECFPKKFYPCRLDWTIWKMAVIPYLPEMVEYVKTLDVHKDLEILRTNGIELADRAKFVFRVQHMVLKLGVLGGNVPKDIGDLLTQGLGTLYYNCMARCMAQNPTDVTLILNSLEDSIKDALQWTRDLRTEKESMTQRELMLSREEKKTETKPRESRFRRTLRLQLQVDGIKEVDKEKSSTRTVSSISAHLHNIKQEAIATREIKSIGVGVTAEAQKIFDAFSKTLPVQWVNKDILVSGEVRICSPYHDDCVTGGTTTARDQIKAVLKQVKQELQLGTGHN